MGAKSIYKTAEIDGLEVKVSCPDGHGNYHTFDGHKITAKQERFIQALVAGKSYAAAARYAGTSEDPKDIRKFAHNPTVIREMEHRLKEMSNDSIATGKEILEYFTKVMRGEVKDQFGLDAPLGERTSAAKELVKRVVDVELENEKNSLPEIKVTLNWERNEEK